MIEQVEKLSPQFNVLRLTNWEALDYREVHIRLTRPAQNVATDVADVSPGRACGGSPIGTWNYLAR